MCYKRWDMNRFLVILKRPLLALLLFLIFQTLAGVMVLVMLMLTGEGTVLENISNRAFDARFMGIATLACNILIAVSCAFLFRRSIYTQDRHTASSTPWKRSAIALVGCVIGTTALNLLSELVALPNVLEDQMIQMCRVPWGIMAIAIGAPLGEEIMFRWGIMGHMLRRNISVPVSIMTSALFFGLMHFNPAQVFFATAMGIMLGILYWKSGNILWPLALHVLNNSVACLQVWLLGDKVKDYSLVDGIGGNTTAWGAIGVLLVLSVAILAWYSAGKAEPIQDRISDDNGNNKNDGMLGE